MLGLHAEGHRDGLRGRKARVGPPLLRHHDRRLGREKGGESGEREWLLGEDLEERVLMRVLLRDGDVTSKERGGGREGGTSKSKYLPIEENFSCGS